MTNKGHDGNDGIGNDGYDGLGSDIRQKRRSKEQIEIETPLTSGATADIVGGVIGSAIKTVPALIAALMFVYIGRQVISATSSDITISNQSNNVQTLQLLETFFYSPFISLLIIIPIVMIIFNQLIRRNVL